MRLPFKSKRNMRSSDQSSRRSHGVQTEVEDSYCSLVLLKLGGWYQEMRCHPADFGTSSWTELFWRRLPAR